VSPTTMTHNESINTIVFMQIYRYCHLFVIVAYPLFAKSSISLLSITVLKIKEK